MASTASPKLVGSSANLDGRPPWVLALQPFVTGGLAGCIATTVIQPVDMVKVRIQLLPDTPGVVRSPFAVARTVIKESGVLGLYKGLDAGLVRQITYTTARMGIFRVVSDKLKKPEESRLPLAKKAAAGLIAGGLGSLIGNPADLALIRLQADATLPVEARRNYKGVVDAVFRIVREEGVRALWRGSGPTVSRAMALNMGMLASFDQSKEMLDTRIGPGWTSTLLASAISGWFAVTLSLPFDLIKTKIQRMKPDPVTKELPYRDMIDCAAKTFRQGGPLGFYKGYMTYYARIAPHAMITLVFLDFVNKSVFNFYKRSNGNGRSN